MRNSLLFPVMALALASPAVAEEAQPPSPLVTALKACRSIADTAEKAACYDRATDALTSAQESGEVAVVHREQARKVRRSLFGFAVPKFDFFSGKKEEDEPKEIVSSVQSFRSIGNGRYRIGITEASAVWETTESAMLRDPKTGDKVTIQSGVMGSYFLQIGKGRWVRARRIQ